MKQLLKIRTGSKYLLFASATTVLLLLSACQMVIDPALLEDQPMAAATETPTAEATAPAEEATVEAESTVEPAEEPAEEPTAVPTEEPAEEPTPVPTEEPVEEPTLVPTEEPAEEPTAVPTEEPAEEPATETPSGDSSASDAPVVPGVEPAKATVNTNSLQVYEAPSDASEIIGGLEEGETYQVLGISSNGVWVQLELPDAPEGSGWVSASFVTLEGDITNIAIIEVPVAATEDGATTDDGTDAEAVTEGSMADGAMATVNTRSLRVRESPSADSEVITGVRQGETYRVLEVSPDGVWVRLEIARAPEGVGWVAAEFVDIEGELDESTPSDVAETEADAEATSTPEAEAETEPEAEPEATDTATETDESEPAAGSTTEVDAGYALVSTDLPLRVRSEPTTEEENKIGNVFDGEIYRVLEISEDGLWVRIDVPQLEVEDGGWVSAEFLILGAE